MSDFEAHFKGIYGVRWPLLREALLKPAQKVGRPCFDGFATYYLDPASIRVAHALPINEGDRVLDMCAAPGGKALVLIENLVRSSVGSSRAGQAGAGGKRSSEFFANELSLARRKRLEEVMKTHVPPGQQSKIKITSWDASKIGIKMPGSFDKILLDAPCSSERHLLEQNSEMKEWKISRTKQLGQRQYALICSALLALKPGGTMVYSTCSISPLENDAVIERLIDRKGDQIKVDETIFSEVGEAQKYGIQLFPDLHEGQGPLYFSRLIKSL